MQTRYLKKIRIEETTKKDPLQEQVFGPEDLIVFMKSVRNDVTQKMIVILLDSEHYSLGSSIVSAGTDPDMVNKRMIYAPVAIFNASKFIIVTNHPNDNPTPTESDRSLIRDLHLHSKMLLGAELIDYIIVGKDQYFALSVQNGTLCRCGSQRAL